MRNTTRCSLALVLLVAAGLSFSRDSFAYCQLSSQFWWEQNAPITIPVYLNVQMGNMCYPTGNAFCDGFNDVEPTVRVAIDEFNDTAGAKIRFSYAGSTSLPPGTPIADAVHISPVAGLGSIGLSQSSDTNLDGKADQCRVYINSDLEWLAMDGIGPDGDLHHGLHGVVIHELGHCLGFAHTNEAPPSGCGQTVQSVMEQGTYEKSHLFADDILGLQSVYGLRSDSGRVRRSDNVNSWTTASIPASMTAARTRYSITQYRWENSYVSVTTDATTDRIKFAKYSTAAGWTYVGLLPSTTKTEYHTGIAAGGLNSAPDILIGYTGNYQASTGLQDVLYTRSTNFGTTWQTPVVISNTKTYNPGVAVAYDPVTQTFIFLWRLGNGSNREVITQGVVRRADWTVDRDIIEWPEGTSLRSADTPGIACGQPWLAGTENCLLAWTTTQWDHFFYWVQGHVECIPGIFPEVDCEFVFDPDLVMAFPSVVYGQPSVAFTGYDPWPWLITFHQGTAGAFTLRKGTTGDWGNLQTHSALGYVVSPTAGSRKLGPSSKTTDVMYHGSF
jgi:hypothetical protein